jgi:peptidase YpeB-like protein
MRFIIPLAVVAALGASGIALAEIPARDHKADAQAPAMSEGDIKGKIAKLGYDVRWLETKDRHYEAHLVDRASGGAVEATFDKSSGELIGAKLAQDDRDAREHKETRKSREKHEESREREHVKEHDSSREGERRDSDD